ncbi:hypothetical protein [Enterococcus malodoratus]|uniref:hypothetical protein n=1 Tax=Enterococcus malodoratus TaxID=71451 RepID=UPI0039AFD1CF
MRLREVQNIIKDYYDDLDLSTYQQNEYRTGNTTYKKLVGFSRLSTAIKEIKKLGFIDFEIENIEKRKVNLNTFTHDDTIQFDLSTFNAFEHEIDIIRSEVASVDILLRKHLPEQNEQSVAFGLPPYEKYSDVSDTLSEIESILDLLEIPKEEVEVQNFDTGSNWIEILFVGIVHLSLFGGAIKLATNGFVKFQECKLAKRKVDEAIALSQSKEDIYKSLCETFDSQLQNELRPEIEAYLEHQEQESSEERINKTFKGVQKLFELIDEGASFREAFNATDKVKEEFPAANALDVLPTALKKLNPTQYLETDEQSNDTQESVDTSSEDVQ